MNPAESQERDFHDQQAAGIDPADELVGPSFAPVGAPENAQVLERLGSLQGRRVLDLGCGTGTAGAHLAALGARVICVDVSAGMLGVARRVAQGQGGRVQPVVGSAHRLPFASSSMDVVYGYGLLHHVDIEQALAEVARVLRPAGRALFIDPLAYNPLIKAYRRMSRAVHSRHERPCGGLICGPRGATSGACGTTSTGSRPRRSSSGTTWWSGETLGESATGSL